MIGLVADRTVPALLARGTAALESAGIETARPEAEWLLAGLLYIGRSVGLPDGLMGNSEVGHLNLGAGSIIKQDLVRSLLQVAARTRARVIAEGIETPEECEALRDCGVRYGQGFYFARPAPAFPVLARGGWGSA